MDAIIIGIKTMLAFPLVRLGLLAWAGLFVFICILSIATATVPDRKLFAAGRDGARKAPLSAVLDSYRSHPERWLLYEEELFYVRDPESLEGEKREALERARVRCVNGGAEARAVGERICLRRTDVRAYLRFFYGLHRERGEKLPRRKTETEEVEEAEQVMDAEAAPVTETPMRVDGSETPEEEAPALVELPALRKKRDKQEN